MTLASDIVRHAFNSLLVTGEGEDATATQASDGLDLLNNMIHSWRTESVDVLWSDAALSDTFSFWVPPASADGDVINAVAYQGTWNAATNIPALASAAGTKGNVYRVATSGTTALDAVSSWSVGDYLVYDGVQWLKGRTSREFERAIIAMLGMEMSTYFSAPIPPQMAQQAEIGWRAIASQYVLPGTPVFDPALTRLPSRRWAYTSSGVI